MRTKKSKWNVAIDNENVSKFIETHNLNIWYKTAYGEICMILVDSEIDTFLINITDLDLGHFDIITNMTYLSFDLNLLGRIYQMVKKDFYTL